MAFSHPPDAIGNICDTLSGDSHPDFLDAVHELAHALDVYLVPDVAVPLEGAAGDGAVGNGKLLGDVGQLHAGVGKDRRVGHDILDPLEDRGVGFGACRQAGYTQRVGPAVEHRRAGDGLDVPVAEVSRRLRYDIEQQTDVFAVNAIPVTDHLTGVRVPQAVVAAVDASENLAHELGARRHREIDRRGGVPQHVDAPGHLNIVVQLTDDTGHGHRRDRLNLRQVGQAALVGEHDCVH